MYDLWADYIFLILDASATISTNAVTSDHGDWRRAPLTGQPPPTGVPQQPPPGGYYAAPTQAVPYAAAAPVGQAVPYAAGAPVGQAVPVAAAMPIAASVPCAAAVPVTGPACQAAGGLPLASATPVETTKRDSLQVQTPLPGRRRSLLVGINYPGTECELHGCVNDVKRMVPVLAERGFPSDPEHQLVLLDPPEGSSERPTLDAMRRAIAWLVQGAQTGDALFFHYSGHGGREESSQGADGFCETLCPSDCQTRGMLLDVELFDTLVKPLPSACRLTCLLDCCHSGGALNLPYLFVGTAENMRKAFAGEAVQMAMSKNWIRDVELWRSGNPGELMQDLASMGLGLWQLRQQAKASQNANESGFATDEATNAGLAVGEVVAITGCRSDQTSADVGNVGAQFHLPPTSDGRGHITIDTQSLQGTAGGALTSVFIEALEDIRQSGGGQPWSYLDVLEHIRKRLSESQYTQVPQLATSLLIDLKQPYSLDTITLPANPGTGGRDMGGGSSAADPSGMGMAGVAGVGAAALGAGAMASFMSSMMAAPAGASMVQSEQSGRDMGGGTSYDASADYCSTPNLGDGLPGALAAIGGLFQGGRESFETSGSRRSYPLVPDDNWHCSDDD